MPPRENNLTLSDIGRRAGVSAATVSRALRDDPSISVATRERVRAAAQALGYVPDPLLTKLMRRLRNSGRRSEDVIALLIHSHADGTFITNPTVSSYIAGARQRAQQLGYRLENVALDAPGMSGRRVSHILHSRGLRGVLVAPTPEAHSEPSLDWSLFAAATMGNSVATPLHRATGDQTRQAQLAVRELTRAGYRRIGLVLRTVADERAAGFWRAGYLGEQWLLPPAQRLAPLITPAEEDEFLVDWIRQWKPDAIIGLPGTRQALRKLKWLRPPQKVFASLNVTEPKETGINQNHVAVGEAAFDLVLEQLMTHAYGLPAMPKNVRIDCFWQRGDDLPA